MWQRFTNTVHRLRDIVVVVIVIAAANFGVNKSRLFGFC